MVSVLCVYQGIGVLLIFILRFFKIIMKLL